MSIFNPTAAATRSVVEDNKLELLKSIADQITLVKAEFANTRGADRARAAETLQFLKGLDRFNGMAERSISKSEAHDLLAAINQVSIRVSKLAEISPVGKDGQTLTERAREEQAEVLDRARVVALLEQIAKTRGEEKEEISEEAKKAGSALTDIASVFLGPAGPVFNLIREFKEDTGITGKAVANTFRRVFAMNQDLAQQLERQGQQQLERDHRLFGGLTAQFKRMTGALSGMLGSGGGDGSSWLDHLGGKRGTGRGGMFTKMRRGLRKLPGIGRLFRGGGKGILGTAGRFLGKAGKFAGKAIPGLGAALGIYDLATGAGDQVDKGKTGEGALGDYAGGALSGAAVGALGGPLGAAIGAVVGLAFTGIVRNWSAVKSTVSDGWNWFTAQGAAAWKSTKDFAANMAASATDMWDNVKRGVSRVGQWFSDHIPGFSGLKNAAVAIAAPVVQAVQTAANTAQTVGGQTGAAITGAVQSVANTAASEMPGGAVASAAQGLAKFTGKLTMPNSDITGAITGAADTVGVDRGYMLAMAGQESGFNPMAKAGTSSAAGLYQFTNGTWAEMVKKYGAQFGIGLNDRFDAHKNAIMGALYSRDNGALLKKSTGQTASATDLYMAHFLGPAGASKFLNALNTDGTTIAAQLFPAQAAANHGVFYDGRRPRTMREVYAFFQNKIGSKAQAYAAASSTRADPQVDGYARVVSKSAGANVNVSAAAPSQSDGGAGGTGGGGGGSATGLNDVPMVVGDAPFLILNSLAFGA